MDTELLRTYRTVLRTGGFTAAARELGYVQSTVTQHVAALERRFGTRLVDRLPSGAVATEAGLRLRELAAAILDLEDRLDDEVAARDLDLAGRVRVTAPDSLCAYRLAPLVADLRAELPAVRVSLAPLGTSEALAALRAGTCEIAVLLEPSFRADDLDVRRVGAEELVLLASTPMPRRRTWTALGAHDFLLLEEGCCYSDETEGRLQAAAQPEERRVRFGSIETVKACVAAGMGVAVLPRVAVRRELDAGVLTAAKGPLPATPLVFAAVHARRTPTAATLAVLDRLETWWPARAG